MECKRAVLLIHGDSDGVCSGALAYRVYSSVCEDVEVVFSHPAGLADDLVEFIRPGDLVFIADIALSEKHLSELIEIFREQCRSGRIIYVDHHPEPLGVSLREIPGTIVHSLGCSASELTYKFLSDKLSNDYTRVALYGAIGDYMDQTSWVRETLDMWDKRTIYFEAGVLSQGLEASRKMYDFKRHVVRHLSENRLPSSLGELLVRALIESANEEELRVWVKANVRTSGSIGYVIDPPGSLTRAAIYARVYSGRRVGLAASRHKSTYVMSLRSTRGIDLNSILRRITPKLNGTGGGHEQAAGARVPVNKFYEFLKILDGEVKKLGG